MSRAPTFAELRDRAGFAARARPLVRARPAARVVLVVAAILAFLAVCVTLALWGGFDDASSRSLRSTDHRPYAWIPASHTAALLGGALAFAFPARRAWRVGAALLLVAFLAPVVGLAVLAGPAADRDGGASALGAAALLSALPVTGLVALGVETRRRLRWDRFR